MSDAKPQRSLRTGASLRNDFTRLGVKLGSTVLLHSSLSSIGYVVGGAQTVVSALLDTIGESGTLVVPTHSGDNSDPAQWSNPPVPEEWWSTIRETMPPFDPRVTRLWRMGVIADTVRTWPGAKRSGHPQTSFTAVGPQAKSITDGHVWNCALGEQSPLARLEELNADILLLGVRYRNCTSFHLAEYRLPGAAMEKNSFAVLTESGRVWMTVQDCHIDNSRFNEIGQAFEAENSSTVLKGKVGDAECRLFPLALAVHFAENWLQNQNCHR